MRTAPLKSLPRVEHGKGGVGCIFSLLLLSAAGYVLYKLAPPYVDHYQLKDAMKEIATLSAAGVSLQPGGQPGKAATVSEIQDAVMAKARELDIPLRKQDIRVERVGNTVTISVTYTIPLSLLGYAYDYKFDFSSHN